MLGLADIVVPGIFLNFLAKWDAMRMGEQKSASFVYLNTAMIAYVLGFVTSVSITLVFDAAQPALLYIVPYVLITSLAVAVMRGECWELLSFTIPDEAAEKQAKKAEKKAAQEQKPAWSAMMTAGIISEYAVEHWDAPSFPALAWGAQRFSFFFSMSVQLLEESLSDYICICGGAFRLVPFNIVWWSRSAHLACANSPVGKFLSEFVEENPWRAILVYAFNCRECDFFLEFHNVGGLSVSSFCTALSCIVSPIHLVFWLVGLVRRWLLGVVYIIATKHAFPQFFTSRWR